MTDERKPSDSFDIDGTVDEYFRVWLLQDAAETSEEKAQYQPALDRLKAPWKVWKGDDNADLHLTVFPPWKANY